MQQTKTAATHPQTKTIGEKIVSVLRQPLFIIPLPKPIEEKRPAVRKHESSEADKPAKQKKSVKRVSKRPMPVDGLYRPLSPRNASQNRKTASYIFTPERNKDEFEKILFILRACEKYGGVAFTNVLHVEQTKNGSRLIATDRIRMHVAEIEARIKPGNYKPVITENTIKLGAPVSNISFPNWERVVPANIIRCGCINLNNAVTGTTSRACDSLTKLTGEKVNPNYLADLTKKPWVIFRQKEKGKAMLLKEYGAKKEMYAVIMPLAS
jgi:hypothetical protein